MRKTILTLALVAAGAAVSVPAQAQQLRMMTGPQGGAWYPLGGAIQGMASDALGVSIQVLPGGGVANVQGVQNGDADLGFANSISTVDAIEGREPFEGKADNVCNLATLYPQYFQMVVTADSGIASVKDFAGKRLNTQPVGNTAEQVTRAVLQTAGISYEDLKAVDFVSYSDGVALMQDNNSEVFALGTTIPSSAIMDLANSTAIKLVPLEQEFIDKMRSEINPGYTSITIPAGTYPKQDEDVVTVGYATHVIARCDLEVQIVEGLLTQMWENRSDLATIASAVKDMSLETMAQDVGVPMHEGAKAFYAANGVAQ
ncbi:TAXI family TRAP transporter solute-binding subunit [Chelativorans xinjiangense]|uniref:TAXI family TRAP transporter solute-binding subunit n=1 Tax=Chelativorans xinjiangense TaxID=2681485 RepID=UPI00135C08EB|nr:TAXI family TRAP transporter solute-binding subunit [Chelativorans xinjiangense]